MSPEAFLLIAKALSDPQRSAILERIARESEVACKTLVEEFHITPATISHHCRELFDAGLIDCRREGKCAYFAVRTGALKEFAKSLDSRFALRKRRGRVGSASVGRD